MSARINHEVRSKRVSSSPGLDHQVVCTCGWASRECLEGSVERVGKRHLWQAANYADVNGAILRPGDVVRAEAPEFDGPEHLRGVPLVVTRRSWRPVHVAPEGSTGQDWPVTASTLLLVRAGPVFDGARA